MENTALRNRLRRVEGQIQKLQNQIEENAACEDVIPQFLATKGAINAALQLYVNANIQKCTTADTDKLQSLIQTLTKL